MKHVQAGFAHTPGPMMHTGSAVAPAPRSHADPAFRRDVRAGLDQAQRAVPSRWLYDHRGSVLFEAITRLPECTCAMAAGETIRTENSVKYRPDEARRLLRAGGWSPVMEWTDRLDHLAVILARRIPPAVHRGTVAPDTVEPGRSGVAS